MDLFALRYFMEDRVKPVYHMLEDDKIILTAKIIRDRRYDKKTKTVIVGGRAKVIDFEREHGLYFVGVVLNRKVEWSYTYKGYHDIPGGWYELEFEQHLKLDKRMVHGVISNTLMYKKCNQKNIKDLVVVYE